MKMRKNQNVTNKAYRFRIEPDAEQKVLLAKTFGCCRYLWNRMLSDKQEYYKETGLMLDVTPAKYKQDPECSWLSEVDCYALQNVQLNLNQAYKTFFAGEAGFPKFKKKNVSKNSYTTNLSHGNISLDGNLLKLPKFKKPIKTIVHRTVKVDGKLKSVTVTQEPNGNYYASLLYEYPKEEITHSIDKSKAVGLDMSMKELYVSSDGEFGNYPRFYRQTEKRIAREQRKLSHMQQNSKNYEKQRKKIAKLHAKTKRQRSDFLHKASHSLVNQYDIICVEDLNMRAMSQSLNLGKSVCDNGWGMFTTMLDYKLKEKGGKLIKIDKWFPSSKTCSACGCKNDELALKDRIFVCPVCGNTADRDLQAAYNILTEGLRVYSVS